MKKKDKREKKGKRALVTGEMRCYVKEACSIYTYVEQFHRYLKIQ